MGVKFAVETKKGDSYRFSPSDLHFSTFTGRHFGPSEESIERMVESLLKHGQLEDVGVRKDFDGLPVVVFGHTRVLAAQRINERNLTPEPFMLRGTYFSINEEEACLLTLKENDDDTRTAVSPVDVAFMIRQLETRYGYTQTEIAEKLGKKQAEISKYRKLLELDSKTQKEIAVGRMNLHMALTLTNIKPEERTTVLELAKEEAKATGKKVTSRELVNTARSTGATTKTALKRSVGELRKVLVNERDRPKSKRAAFLITSSILDFLDGKDSDLIDVIRGL